jgi:hypothetical protein
VHEFSNGTTAQDIDRRLWLELTEKQYALVRELIRLEADAPIVGLLDETDRLIDGLVKHLPQQGPSIRVVAQYLIESGVIYEDGVPTRACCRHRPHEDGAGSAS